MGLITFLFLAVGVAAVAAAVMSRSGARPGGHAYLGGAAVGGPGADERTADAEAEARRWVERLAAGLTSLDGAGDPAATQALADATERHAAVGGQLSQARSTAQYALASQTAVEGLHYIRAARVVLGLDPGPPVPALAGWQQDDGVAAPARVLVGGREHVGSLRPGAGTPYYYPGGMVAGQPMPAGWYSAPWWKTALAAGAAGAGGALLADFPARLPPPASRRRPVRRSGRVRRRAVLTAPLIRSHAARDVQAVEPGGGRR